MTNKKLEQAMPYILVGICFTPIGILVSEWALSLGLSSISSHLLLILVVGLALIFYHQFQQLFNELFERMIMKVPYFRNRWKKSSAEEVNAKVDESDKKAADMKVRAVVILELLRKMELGTNRNDLTKICMLIAFLTGNKYTYVLNELQKGVHFSEKAHKRQIDEVNKMLSNLNASISIDINKQY